MRLDVRKSILLAITFLTIVVLITVWKPWKGTMEPLTVEAATNVLLTQYDGEVSDVWKQGDVYTMKLGTKQGVYQVEVDAFNGEVVALQLLERIVGETIDEETAIQIAQKEVEKEVEKRQTDTNIVTTEPSNKANQVIKPEPTRQPKKQKQPEKTTSWLSEEKVGKLAQAHIAGEIDDIDFYKPKTGPAYYLVEIETLKDRDAIVQVNALSGVIMSVVWDDDDDEFDDD